MPKISLCTLVSMLTRMEALRRVGFEETDLFDSGHAPYRLETYTQKGIYLIYENADFAGGIFAAPSVPVKKALLDKLEEIRR